MNLMNRLTVKNLKLNKKRTIVTVIGILLSTALLTAVSTMFFSAKASFIVFQQEEQGNYHYAFDFVSAEDLNNLQQNRKIESILVTKVLGYAKLEDNIQTPSRPYAYVREFSQEAMEQLPVCLIDGRYPQNDSELVISAHLKGNGELNYKIGDQITLEIGERQFDGEILCQDTPYSEGEQLVNTKSRTYTIVGIMKRFPHRLESYSSPGYVFISYLEEPNSLLTADVYVRYTKQALGDPYRVTAQILDLDEDAFDTIARDDTLNMSYEEYENLQQQLSDPKYSYTANEYLIALESGVLGNSTLKQLASAAVFVIVIIIGTSIFCIKNSFDISITEKIRQYGMLASIGATKKQIRKNVYFEALLLGIMGIPLGIISGILAAAILVVISDRILSTMMTFHLMFSFSWIAVVCSALLGIATVLLSARKSAKKASKITPIQAIRNSAQIKIKTKDAKSPKWIARLFGIGGEIAYKNLKRSRKRYRTTVISIVICVSVFISLSSFISMAFAMIQMEYTQLDYNLQIVMNSEELSDKALEKIRGLDEIRFVTNSYTTYMQLETDTSIFTDEYLTYNPWVTKGITDGNGESQDWIEDLRLYLLDEESFQTYAKSIQLDDKEIPSGAILLNTMLYTDDTQKRELVPYTLKQGDILSGLVWKSEEEEETVTMTIAKVTDQAPAGVNILNSEPGLILNKTFYKSLIAKDGTLYLLMESSDPYKNQEDIETILNDMEDPIDYYINNTEETASQMRSFYFLLSIFLYGFLTVIALIGVTNIFNTITTNMNLRQREFAMLRSIGMTTREFNRMILLESIFYGMRALLLGIPLGCILSYAIYLILIDGELVVAYTIPFQAICVSAICVFFLLTVIMRYSLSKIRKQNIIETIRNENI